MLKPLPNIAPEDQPDGILFRMNIYAEARNQPYIGMVGVACVVITRAKKSGKGIRAEILKRKAFSWLNDHEDANYKAVARLANPTLGLPYIWGVIDGICSLIEANLVKDPTFGSDHYYNPKVAKPIWGKGHPNWVELATLGDHVFGRAP